VSTSSTPKTEQSCDKKQCKFCSGDFFRKKNQSRVTFKAQQFCSMKCGKEYKRAQNIEKIKRETKICKNPKCKKSFHRRISPNSIESLDRWKLREVCSRKCIDAVRTKSNSPWQKKGSGGGKRPKPPVTPPKEPDPDPPKPVETQWVEVWRPASLGGPFMRKVS